jgi:YesN/AraC family two-component response regulator
MNRSILKKLSLLYVEDDKDIQEELQEVLELDFKTLYTASNGQDGLDLFKKYKPDIVISDIQMPKMNGLEMCEQIRTIDSNVPIVITTAFNEPSFLIKSIDIGVDKYVLKPIDIFKLEQTLMRCAKFVFQQKTINDLQKLSKKLMDKHDNFIFISGDEFNYINKPLLNFLGFNTLAEFEKNNLSIFDKLKDITQEEICQTKKDWLIFLENNLDQEHIIYFKECINGNHTIVPYKVTVEYFDEIEHYLIIFNTIEEF